MSLGHLTRWDSENKSRGYLIRWDSENKNAELPEAME